MAPHAPFLELTWSGNTRAFQVRTCSGGMTPHASCYTNIVWQHQSTSSKRLLTWHGTACLLLQATSSEMLCVKHIIIPSFPPGMARMPLFALFAHVRRMSDHKNSSHLQQASAAPSSTKLYMEYHALGPRNLTCCSRCLQRRLRMHLCTEHRALRRLTCRSQSSHCLQPPFSFSFCMEDHARAP